MTVFKRFSLVLLAVVLGLGGIELGERMSVPGMHSLISPAYATVGRPLTPVSVAGVARRSNRRN